jgi:mannose-1-phosphate guanylyltransferase/mannose-6-phosphate isomerase
MKLQPVIMSGGSGTRLWPLSTEAAPKQFHALASEWTMLQDTCLRVAEHQSLAVSPPLVICNHRHADLVAEQFDHLGQSPAAVILEPFGRNTAAVAVVAAAWTQRHASDAFVLLLPADHVVLDADGFRAAIGRAVRAANDHVVTFGISPTGPETGYGYIQRGKALYEGAFEVKRFVEKPDSQTALTYLAEGGYAWNAGIFLFRPDLLLEEAERRCPIIRAGGVSALEAGVVDGVFTTLDAEAFGRCPSESIDTAIMEKTDRAAVVPCDVGWADVGSWSELWRHGRKDAGENVSRGEIIAVDVTGSIMWSDGPTIAAVGVTDLIIIAAGGHVLVLPKDRAQDVKKVVEALKAKGR